MIKIKMILICLFLLLFASVNAMGQDLSAMPTYEMPNTQVVPINDAQSNKQYELLIKLPEKYTEDKEKKYPVVYFTDAVWHIESLSSASSFLMEDVILVGISWQKNIAEDLKQQYGVHFSRHSDYSIKKRINSKHPKIKFGQAENHLSFIRQDVFDYIEKNYRIEPNNRTYFGFSAGGLFGTYALMTQPNTFNNYILGSPSLWGDLTELFAQEHVALNNKNSKINIFTSYGELEKELSPILENFISKLKSKKYIGISSIKHIVIEDAGHSDSFPMMAIRSVKWLSNLQKEEDK